MTAPQTVSLDQRHTRSRPCQICGGYSAQPQGKGVRCAGFRSADNEYEHCQREQYAGALPLDEQTTPPTYAHRMRGDCRCGVTHGPTTYGPRPQAQSISSKTKQIVHVSREADGTAVGDHVRLLFLDDLDSETGKPKKRGPWWEHHSDRSPTEMPLYGLPRLAHAAPDAPAWMVEGEPAQEALQAALDAAHLPDVAVGTVTGAPAIPCDDRLRVLLGRPVTQWADNDTVGRQQMERIAERLVALGTDLPKRVNWQDAPPKGDAADYFAAGGTVEGLAALIEPVASGEAKGGAHPSTPQPTVRRWPEPLNERAYYGVLGKIAREMEPYIEADSAALLVNLVSAAGAALGRGPHMRVGAKRHYACTYVVNAGATGDNKGDGWWPIDTMLEQVTATAEEDSVPLKPLTWGGMSTGEGLLWQVRDERRERRQGRRGEPAEEVIADAGVTDKRLLVFEPEFARVLAVMYREGNILSMILRDLYDGASKARSSPKANPIIATGAHVGLIGQITPEELSRKLHEVELFNGFANRFLWIVTKRKTSLPNPPTYTEAAAEKHAALWSAAIAQARSVGEITRDAEAAQVWDQIYEALRTGQRDGKQSRSGMALDVCARAHVHVMRHALTFAALDGSAVLTAKHQEAALAIWDYAEASAMYLFGHVSGDPIAEVIADALVARGPLTRTQISQLFNRHVESGAIQTALDTLAASGRGRMWKEQTSGGPREMWGAS